ncbi:1,4-alpha-glucan branching enzyme GlgB [Hartmannibacter diazotrophicus]|uniref:1,4-alpha-glucan branching enzyme GlgB n=1 Tax=Hartmannibacter diazotrophicus TaxID=1482074 RepID=A0A2C9D1G1_9HYPH|nr:1,4-alpha-glucan branching protein GlgB [Hartmannibacter diazotrophicus]SON54074.1 1,4-alpha-glucan branching enzyme GlgB [Hartmannibacter diazotrophicus]
MARGKNPSATKVDQGALQAVLEGRHGDPFAFFGPQEDESGPIIRAFLPGCSGASVIARSDHRLLGTLEPVGDTGLMVASLEAHEAYLLRIDWHGHVIETEDPYSFGPLLGEMDVYLIREGTHLDIGRCLGAQATVIDGISGVRFAVWAPNAERVSVVGDFNSWDGRRHMMRKRLEAGVFEIFVPRIWAGERYRYEIRGAGGILLPQKSDPVGRQFEMPPSTCSVVTDPTPFGWSDESWMQARADRQASHAAMSIYEIHAGSWRRRWDSSVDWRLLIDDLIPYVQGLGFTHIELMPIMEHPFGGSWGYQPLGLFAPTARYGSPHDFAAFVNACHNAGIGVLLDWVPAHFPTDEHGLAHFDGTALYEHADPKEGFHQDWNTLIFNMGRNEVVAYLIASALEWLEHFHIDGLRVDAVASMLYRDYSREEGQWVPNRYGGRENLEAVAFLKRLNTVIAERVPGAITIAEESTSWPQVSGRVSEGGLGFNYKWNMGWMNDTLSYMGEDPVYRRWHHDKISFGLVYAFSERFVLPLSHDEVVHGKRSLIGRMPGDHWQKFANLRALFGLMWMHPGKKLLFMGGEIAQEHEWRHDDPLDWWHLEHADNRGVQHLVRDLNHLYAREPALHLRDAESGGFQWILVNERETSIYAFLRWDPQGYSPVLVIANMTPVPRFDFAVGVPKAGYWKEVLNTDSEVYGGSNHGNFGGAATEPHGMQGFEQMLKLTIPPLGVLALRFEG